MEQPPSNIPPQTPPPSAGASSSAPPPVPTPSAARPPAKKWPWILGGCGCLTIIGIIVILVLLGLIGKNVKRAATTIDDAPEKYNPYKGSLTDLLPPQMSHSGLDFKRLGTSDKTNDWSRHNAVEATGFTYMQTAMGIGVKIDGALINFASSADAVAALKATASENGGSVEPKGKGHRFTAQNGKIIAWTNGSLMCVVVGGSQPAAGNFEKAAPF